MRSGLPGAAKARGSTEKEKNALKLKERGREERGAYSTALHPGNAVCQEGRNAYETELDKRQSVESNIRGLGKVVDDTNITKLQLETEIEALEEELLFMKNHDEEVKGLEAQIAISGLTMEVDAHKSQDLSKIMADIWAQYEKLAQKNHEELDRGAEAKLTDLRHTLQALEIDLDAMKNQKISLEAGYDTQMEQLNGVLLHLESELTQTRAEGQQQNQEYEALMNIKVKPESETATYHRLL
ncbi:Keratin, type I cytoskeletal 18 [Microtus ochrogaster]|uniref:Keratin, type I cytoskeletal 18 n=1 Tax=Microtus ochrogaster TaxID=79684 RepID=A0A8J6GXZ3_MICOH|nr:Keratin, type I cytoskeletal 18 [Microtus ochrogaster]